jgi:hypothetical protein
MNINFNPMYKTSDTITSIGKALLAFDKAVTKIGKTEINPYFKNKYAPLSEILDAIKEPLQDSGLTVKQFPTGEHGMTTVIIHAESGEYIASCYTMAPSKNDPQGEGSRITYQRRYALGAALSLNIDEDDDGNTASGNKPKRGQIPEDRFKDLINALKKEKPEGWGVLITAARKHFTFNQDQETILNEWEL